MSSSNGSRSRLRKLGRAFYGRPAIDVAFDLIGAVIVHHLDGQTLRARIVETEAYVGPQDLASHSSKGRTKRTEVMFGPPGRAYVYFIYGMHEMFNIVASAEGDAQALLVRAAEPLDGWEANLSGPGRFARGMRITRADNARDLTGDTLYVTKAPDVQVQIIRSPRVGVDYAEHWKDALLRFSDANSGAVSSPRPVPRSADPSPSAGTPGEGNKRKSPGA
ncbi:MAG TPA: DNA-3-methyladenine glycosylase [Tepidisphaeraceae bacterium]|jgi:DNA-3-methyladenine glycosylase